MPVRSRVAQPGPGTCVRAPFRQSGGGAYSTIRFRPAKNPDLDRRRGRLRGHLDFFAGPRRDHRPRLPGGLAHTSDPQQAGKREGADGAFLDVALDENAQFVEHCRFVPLRETRRFGKGSHQLCLGHRFLERGDLAGSGSRHVIESPMILWSGCILRREAGAKDRRPIPGPRRQFPGPRTGSRSAGGPSERSPQGAGRALPLALRQACNLVREIAAERLCRPRCAGLATCPNSPRA